RRHDHGHRHRERDRRGLDDATRNSAELVGFRMSARAPGWSDWFLALGGAIILADAFDAPLYRAFGWRATILPGVPISRLLLLGVFVAAGVLIAGDARRALAHARAAALLWPAIALAFVSALWSERPATTLLWSAALLGTSAFGVALAVRF